MEGEAVNWNLIDAIGYRILFWSSGAAIIADAFGWEPSQQMVRAAAFTGLLVAARVAVRTHDAEQKAKVTYPGD